MKKTFNYIFPFIDFVYILQLEEYSYSQYFYWIKSRLLKRGFQKVGKIKWTFRAKATLVISILLFILSIFLVFYLDPYTINRIILILILIFLIPFFVLDASILFIPIDFIYRQYLSYFARKKLSKMQCKVVAIAGSYGKSTTRHFANAILSKKFKVRTPKKNYNTLFSVPKDIIKNLDKDTQIYLVELGESYKGDFEKFVKLLKPDMVVITAIGPQHLSTFGSQEVIDREFLSLLNLTSDKPQFMNISNEGVNRIIKRYKADFGHLYNIDIKLKIKQEWQKSETLLQNISGALAISRELGMNDTDIEKALEGASLPERRMKEEMHGEIKVIDDTYNINPDSAKAALEYLDSHKGRKIIVTGGIVDQGENEKNANIALGEQIAEVADIVIIAKNILFDYVKTGVLRKNTKTQILESDLPSETPDILGKVLKQGDTVLIQNELQDNYWS